jgi:hypothetical protein
VLSYYASLRSEFRVVMYAALSAYKRCSVCLFLQLFVEGLVSYLYYLCLLTYSGVQLISCYVFVLFVFALCIVYPMLSVSLGCSCLIALSVFSNVYLFDFFKRFN